MFGHYCVRMASLSCRLAQIADVLRREADLDEACQALVRGTNEGGGPDNVTTVVVEVDAV